MSVPTIPAAVARAFPHYLVGRAEYLAGAGGYSGARFWKVAAASGKYCLRRWPKGHPTPQRLAFQHGVLNHAGRRIGFVPLPVPSVQGETWISAAGHLWEVTPWMSGTADFFPERHPAKLAAAFRSLAEFHAAVADFASKTPHAVSPTAAQRLEILDQAVIDLPKFDAAFSRGGPPREFTEAAEEILTGFRRFHREVRSELVLATTIETPIQPVIRDIHAEHILFEAAQVSGIVDFGAMNDDSIAVDISRLLGSLAMDDVEWRQIGLTAYETVLTLNTKQIDLVRIFDRSAVVLSGMNWLRWILLEGRTFDDFSRVLARLQVTCGRLRHLINAGG